MKYIVSGHRLSKLENYDIPWIKNEMARIVSSELPKISLAYSGMASGVDLWFCEACLQERIPYIACIPFDEQADTMNMDEGLLREKLIDNAVQVLKVRNRVMVEKCDAAFVVWDGNKGGTHNVVQQLVENKKGFYWLNPVAKKTWRCF